MTRTASGLLVPTLVVSLLLIHPAAGAARPQMLEQVVEAGGGRTAVHLRILGGCEGQAIDRVELTIPEAVVGVAPEAVAGWTVETDRVATEPYEVFGTTLAERVGTVRWIGSLAEGQFLDLAFVAVFPDAGEFVFPVLQGCGTTEVDYSELVPEGTDPSDVELRAPTLEVVEPAASIDLPELQATVDELKASVSSLQEELKRILNQEGFVAVPKLRDDVEALQRAVNRLRDRLDEVAPVESPTP